MPASKLANGKQKGCVISNANAPTYGANLAKFKSGGCQEWNILNEISVKNPSLSVPNKRVGWTFFEKIINV